MPDVAPECTTAGSVAYWQWLSCGKYYADESAENELGVKDISLPAVGHCFKATVVAPTCTENGRTLHKCEFCDESYIDKVVEKLGHDFVELAEESSPTCTANGNLTTPLVESEDLTVCGDVSAVYKYTYDKNGNITEIRGRNNELHSSYEYDGLNRLIRENVAGLTITLYFYDDYGNLSYKKTFSYQDYIDSPTSVLRSNMTAPTISYRYDTAGNMKRLCSYGSSKIITYDNFGNPLQWFKHSSIDARVGYDLSWSKMNRLTGVTDLETKERCEYTYNHSGIRTGKKVGNTVYKYYLDGTSIVAETRTTGGKTDVLKYYYGATGLIGFNYNGTDYYYKKNTRGDILRIYNGAGEACGQYRYDAWGKCVVEWDPYGIAAVNPFRYRSYYLDNETELCYLNSRYYDSAVGRFLSPDSLDYLDPETIGGLNLYAYCYNNPVNYYDPSGHIVVTALLVGLIFGLAALFVLAGTLMLYSEQIGNAFAQFGNMVSNGIYEIEGWFSSLGVRCGREMNGTTGVNNIIGNTIFSKTKNEGRDSGLRDKSDKDLADEAKKAKGKYRNRLIKELKMRGKRNVQKKRGGPHMRGLWILLILGSYLFRREDDEF